VAQNMRVILLALLALVYFVSFNTSLPVTDPVESNYALTAKEMVDSGNYLSPQIYGEYWFDKPIMIYWLLAACFKLIGMSEFAARLPSGIFSAASLLLVYWFSYRIYRDRQGAMLAVIVLATSLQFWILSKSIITDAVLFFFTSASMAAFYLGLIGEGRKWYIAAYALAGFAVLTKGPVGIVLPAITIFIYIAVTQQWHLFKKLHILRGTAAFLLVAAPWYLFMWAAHGQAFIEGFLGGHNFIRATVSEHPKYNVFYYYLVIFPLSLLPWTGALLVFIKDIKRQMRFSVNRYLVIWPLVMIIFYTCMATKYITYVYPALFPVSILLGNLLVALKHQGKKWIWLYVSLPSILLFLLMGVGANFLPNAFVLPIYVVAALAILLIYLLQFKGDFSRIPEAVAIGVVIVSMVFVKFGLSGLVEDRSAKSLAKLITHDEAVLTAHGGYATSMVFYSGLEMPLMERETPDRGIWSFKHTMPLETPEEFFERAQDKPAYILARTKQPEQLMSNPIFNGFELIGKNRDLYLLYRAKD